MAGIIIFLSISIISVSVFAYSNWSIPELDDIRESFEAEIGNFSEDILEEEPSESVQEMEKVADVEISEEESMEHTESILEVDENADVVISGDEPKTASIEQIQDANKIVKDESTRAENNLDELRVHMLDMINSERLKVGLNQIKLGTNTAAQSHADDMIVNCFAGHWGTSGLKPYMRYTLAGGNQHNAENVSGLNYCIKPWENYSTIDPKASLSETMDGFMSSPGHRDNILDPHHAMVNIGLAWDKHNKKVVQHFEYDYAQFTAEPTIDGGVLSFSINTKNTATFLDNSSIHLLYDPPPHELTRGQLANTYGYNNGVTAAAIISPPPHGGSYSSYSYQEHPYQNYPDPYHIAPDTPAPKSVAEAQAAHQQALQSSKKANNQSTRTIPFIVAEEWESTQNSLTITSNISTTLLEYGPGVYTVLIWGVVKGDGVIISTYSLFYNITS
ncbi:MAG: hypothetical protein OXC46_04460 [Thaumarchaeota archaeon]|nr:hypothetical protein [Nitrososphaerota archaeon]